MMHICHHYCAETFMLERLFSSKTRVELLGRVLLHPTEEYHARELERMIGPGSYRAVWLELKNLERLGVVISRRVGRTVKYRLNEHSSLVPELRELFRKNWAAGEILAGAFDDVPGIDVAFIYGSFAAGDFGPRSDVDVMIIGRPDIDMLDDVLVQAERELAREINYRLFTPEEWRNALAHGSPFLEDVKESPKVFVVGSESGLEGIRR